MLLYLLTTPSNYTIRYDSIRYDTIRYYNYMLLYLTTIPCLLHSLTSILHHAYVPYCTQLLIISLLLTIFSQLDSSSFISRRLQTYPFFLQYLHVEYLPYPTLLYSTLLYSYSTLHSTPSALSTYFSFLQFQNSITHLTIIFTFEAPLHSLLFPPPLACPYK